MKITIQTIVSADKKKVWDYYTEPKHIVNWNFASDNWCCPGAENDLRIGGKYKARMEAKDKSVGFDFEAVYNEIVEGEKFTYTMEDGREVNGSFEDLDGKTKVTIIFDAEKENSEEMQKDGWQSILNQFKSYVEKQQKEIIAKASVNVDASPSQVWEALTNSERVKQYMFGAEVISTWKEGTPIKWKGEWKGKTFEDKGKILKIESEQLLKYTHFSPLTGKEDKTENYHTVTIRLNAEDNQTNITLTQEGNGTEQEKEHSEKNWQMMLENLKKIVENE